MSKYEFIQIWIHFLFKPVCSSMVSILNSYYFLTKNRLANSGGILHHLYNIHKVYIFKYLVKGCTPWNFSVVSQQKYESEFAFFWGWGCKKGEDGKMVGTEKVGDRQILLTEKGHGHKKGGTKKCGPEKDRGW